MGAAAPTWPDEFEDREHADQVEAPEELVETSPRARRRGKRRRGLWMTLLVLLVVGGGAGAYWWFQPELPIPEWSTITNKWSAITSAISGQVSALKGKLRRSPRTTPPPPQPRTRAASRPATEPPAAPGPTRPAPSQAAPSQPAPPAPRARLDVVADSLTQVVRAFGERTTLFARGQLLCAGLARSLATVESRWLAYNGVRRSAGVLDAAHAARDQALYAGVDSVERRFEQTGCPRP
ncbi:MAG: hypothetical protein DMD60_04570 [Gemmatimonadetes bacterium]|nr:MAG: hypothetical protein DMD60_04570 [Gemmatimonadota bacterium]